VPCFREHGNEYFVCTEGGCLSSSAVFVWLVTSVTATEVLTEIKNNESCTEQAEIRTVYCFAEDFHSLQCF
jgi:hypothetical protein